MTQAIYLQVNHEKGPVSGLHELKWQGLKNM